MVIGSRKIARGLADAHSRWATATLPSWLSVVPYRCMYRRAAMAAGPATCTKPASEVHSAPPPIGTAALVFWERGFVPKVSKIVLARPAWMAIAPRWRENAQAP